ncbi:Lymphocyte antigen 96 [Lonchura striata]|uniref:Lymphocyte antigen 96 n=1 Tax=Lonchura striata TaxID=40157 RepID=A0A218UP39_9PASE|nr:Lymphocyte antigen 96 [Lonchura striata domestica]
MFGLILFILFTPGVSELICTSSDLEMSYTFCDSMAQAFMFNLTPCSVTNEHVWKAALTWIPRSDIHFLKIVFNVWYDGAKALFWKELLCSGADDEYSVCGTLKGGWCENTWCNQPMQTGFYLYNLHLAWQTSEQAILPLQNAIEGNYSIVVQGFSDDSENNMVICLNFTMIVKQDLF